MRISLLRQGDEQQVLDAGDLFEQTPSLASARHFLADNRNYLLVAYLDDGAPAGFLRAVELSRPDGPERQMFLYEIDVAPEHQRQGIGSALIAAIDQICRSEGFAEMFVITHRSNAPAMRLYAATGGLTESDDEQMFVWTYQGDFTS